MDELIFRISQADADDLEPLLNAVIRRYAELFPDWEVCTISLQKNLDKVKQLDAMISIMEKLKRFPT